VYSLVKRRKEQASMMGIFKTRKSAKVNETPNMHYVAPNVALTPELYVPRVNVNHSPGRRLDGDDLIQIKFPGEAGASNAGGGSTTTISPPNQSDVESGSLSIAQATDNVSGEAQTVVTLPPNPSPRVFSETPQFDNDNDDDTATKNTYHNLEEDAETLKTLRTFKTFDTTGTKDTAFTITRNGQYLTLNGFANGHLLRWKFAAEEGPPFIRIPAILCAIGMIFTTLFPLVRFDNYWSYPILINAFWICFMSFLIIVLEGRALGVRNPTNHRARIRSAVTRYLNLFKLLWGRGMLYIFAGSLNLTIDFEWVVYSAFAMIFVGIIAIIAGAHASHNLSQLRTSLTDESFLWVKFSHNDTEKDGFIELNGFAELLWSLGLEFDDMYTFKAFQQIDRDQDKKISFDEFKHWWVVTQNDGHQLEGSQNHGDQLGGY
jgi:hypothetical protein